MAKTKKVTQTTRRFNESGELVYRKSVIRRGVPGPVTERPAKVAKAGTKVNK